MEKEIFINNIKGTSISISSSVIESVKKSNITKKAVRVYEDGFIGVAGGVGEIGADELERSAKENLKYNIPYTCALEENLIKELDASKEIINEEDFVNEESEFLKELARENSDFIFSNKILLKECSTSLNNSKGLNLKYRDRYLFMDLAFKEKTSASIFDGFVTFEGRSYNRSDFIKYLCDILNGYRNTVQLPYEGKFPVAVTIRDDLFIRAFKKELNGRTFMDGGSVFSGKTGSKLFSDNFTLYQTKNPDDVYLNPFFDMEGKVNDNYVYPLIENGILKTPFTDKKISEEFSIKNTGASSCDYDEVPDLGVPDMIIKSGGRTINELFGGDTGILAFIAEGGNFTPSGEFASPVELAFLYDGERVIGRLPELQISSDIYRMYNSDFRGVSIDSIFKHSDDRLLVVNMDVKLI